LAYLSVTTPDFPQLEPANVPVTFHIKPLAVNVSVEQSQPIVIIAGNSATVTLSIAEAGAGTLFKLGTPSTAPGVTVTLPQSEWTQREIGIGGGSGVQAKPDLTIAASSSANTGNTPQDSTISIPWTAYGGQSKGTVDIQIRVLPKSIGFVSGTLKALGASASAKWALNAQGNWNYSGSINNQEVLASDYSLGMALTVRDAQGKYLTVAHSSNVGPDLPLFNNNDSWTDQGFDQRIVDLWPAIVSAHSSAMLSVSTDAFDAVIEGLGAAIAVVEGIEIVAAAAVMAVLAVAAGAGSWTCDSPTWGIVQGNNGGVAAEVVFTCHKKGQ